MNKYGAVCCILVIAGCSLGIPTFGQQGSQPRTDDDHQSVPVNTQLTLDAAPKMQRAAIRSVLFLECRKTNKKGTAFVVSGGLVVTAAHVVCGCEPADLEGTTTLDQKIHFSKIARDEGLDLAALKANESLPPALQLASNADVALGERVNTWGFPLIYNGPAPLLSVGYASGYYEAQEENFCDPLRSSPDIRHKHIVVNGAFNPGNSGGPLFMFGQDKVIGIVIWKKIAFSNQIQVAIDGFHHSSVSMGGTFSETLPNGTHKDISNEEVIARVLEEFYTKVQVDIGEAVSASELKKFLSAHASELTPPN